MMHYIHFTTTRDNSNYKCWRKETKSKFTCSNPTAEVPELAAKYAHNNKGTGTSSLTLFPCPFCSPRPKPGREGKESLRSNYN